MSSPSLRPHLIHNWSPAAQFKRSRDRLFSTSARQHVPLKAAWTLGCCAKVIKFKGLKAKQLLVTLDALLSSLHSSPGSKQDTNRTHSLVPPSAPHCHSGSDFFFKTRWIVARSSAWCLKVPRGSGAAATALEPHHHYLTNPGYTNPFNTAREEENYMHDRPWRSLAVTKSANWEVCRLYFSCII